MKISKNILLCSILAAGSTMLSAEEVDLDTLSVTATKVERATQKVSSSIEVISKDEIDDKQMTNLQDALKNTTGIVAENLNHGYDVSIYIRGSGIANKKYGTREIMILKDGMPLTDPLGYSDLHSIDTQDIEQIEITKGPGSIYSTGTTGGVIQILSKSVFDDTDNRIKVSFDEHNNEMFNASVGSSITDNHFIRLNATKKDIDNSWRAYSKYNSDSATLKYGYLSDNENSLEVDFSYTDIENWLPEGLDGITEANLFLGTGEIDESLLDKGETREIYTESKQLNLKYIHSLDDDTELKPRAFYTTKDQVTHMGGIGISPDKKNYGVDLELNHNHKLFGLKSELVTGLTYRTSKDDGKTYTFAGWSNVMGTNVSSASSLGGSREELLNLRGDLASEDSMENTMQGIYLQETIDLNKDLTIDFNFRYDKQDISLSNTDYLKYNYYGPYTGRYTDQVDETVNTNKSLDVYAFKLGGTYTLKDTTNLYGLISQGDQAPHDSQFIHNPDLKPSQSRNYEVGLKERNKKFSYDLAVFYNEVKDEIVDVSNITLVAHDADNAGKTIKKGFEFSGAYNLTECFALSSSYTYSNYKYKDLSISGTDVSDNKFKLVPKHMYTLGALYKKDKVKVKLDTKTKGSYYTNDTNTIKHEGYKFITDLMVSYDFHKQNKISLNVNNLFNKKYISQVEGSDYDAGAPRSAMVTYTYKF
jgi:iron complex outermembrane receptor protein